MKKKQIFPLLFLAAALSCPSVFAEDAEPPEEQPVISEPEQSPDADTPIAPFSEESDTDELPVSEPTEVPELPMDPIPDVPAEQEKDDESSPEPSEPPQTPGAPEENTSYTLTLLDGHSDDVLARLELPSGAPLGDHEVDPDLPEGAEEGEFLFDGWYTADGSRFDWDSIMPEHDLTLTARWIPAAFAVRVYPDLDSLKEHTKPLSEETVRYGQSADEPDLPETDDQEFDGWYVFLDGESVPFDFDDEILEDTDIYASWQARRIHVPVIHYIETEDGYTEYISDELPDVCFGEEHTVAPLEIDGYLYNETDSTASGIVEDETFCFELYYDRAEYPCEFRFLDFETGEPLLDPVTDTGLFGEEVTHTAEELPGYSLIGSDELTITIDIDGETPETNVAVFYYEENYAVLSYRLVGELGGASLSTEEEVVSAFFGTAEGCSVGLADGYLFGGWFTDEECTEPVPEEWLRDGNVLIPEKESDDDESGYADAVYYAEILPGRADLILSAASPERDVSEDNESGSASSQTYLFRICGTEEATGEIDLIAAVTNGHTVIRDLPVGTYTIREITEWSWRYRPMEEKLDVTVTANGENVAAFAHERINDHWLSGIFAFFRAWFRPND